MHFAIDKTPPELQALEQERNALADKIKGLTLRDTIITFVVIIFSSIVLGLVVYWYTDSVRNAGIAVAVFPVLGTILSLTGVTKSTGFRSAANSISALNNEMIGLSPVSGDSVQDVNKLCAKHVMVSEYHKLVEEMGRQPVNNELAMFWEFDASTMANTARGREYLNKARDSVALKS